MKTLFNETSGFVHISQQDILITPLINGWIEWVDNKYIFFFICRTMGPKWSSNCIVRIWCGRACAVQASTAFDAQICDVFSVDVLGHHLWAASAVHFIQGGGGGENAPRGATRYIFTMSEQWVYGWMVGANTVWPEVVLSCLLCCISSRVGSAPLTIGSLLIGIILFVETGLDIASCVGGDGMINFISFVFLSQRK